MLPRTHTSSEKARRGKLMENQGEKSCGYHARTPGAVV
ncbi:hypothetical protein WQQ_07880 [Hydrocarboniphaga effusa AP103]|uniref:Uncharacterized protein n=1 Tax=Hydrocarboniphaga effusa AP103 TaxID=1172194 RepID=I8I3L1_9GAMM|nr:hypothetical protein WQQ_07880 [Hydrocarboniphaga effusa AP103]